VEPGELRRHTGIDGPLLRGEAAVSHRRSSSSEAAIRSMTTPLPLAQAKQTPRISRIARDCFPSGDHAGSLRQDAWLGEGDLVQAGAVRLIVKSC